MKVDLAARARLQTVKSVWRSINPEYSLSKGRVTDRDVTVVATRPLAAGVAADWVLQAWKDDDRKCRLRMRMGLEDRRVSALQSSVLGYDFATRFLDFDVLAAFSVLDGNELPEAPSCASTIADFTRAVADYSRQIDRIWSSAGGISAKSLERLAIWALRNEKATGTLWLRYGGICAAFVYGEKELGYELMQAYTAHWERRALLETNDAVVRMLEVIRQDLRKLEDAVISRSLH